MINASANFAEQRTPKVIEVIPAWALEALWERAKITLFPFQREYLLEQWPQGKMVSGGIGGSKTWTTAVEDLAEATICGVIRAQNGMTAGDGFTGRLAIVGKSYKPAQAVFRYLLGFLRELDEIDGTVSMYPDRQWRMVTTAGVEIVTVSAQDPQGFATWPYTRVHITEAAQVPEIMVDYSIERLSRWVDSPIGTLCLEGTFESKGTQAWYIEMAQRWSVPGNAEDSKFYLFPSWFNEKAFPGGYYGSKCQALLKRWRAKNQEHVFDTRFGGKIPSRAGSLWAGVYDPQFHLGSYDRASGIYLPEYIPELPVDFCFDPATHVYAGLFVQRPEPTVVNVFDELVMRNCSAGAYRRAFRESPYLRYETDQDGPSNIGLVISDIAGKARIQGNKSTWENWATSAKLGGCGVTPRGDYLHVETGVRVLQTGFEGEFYELHISPRCQNLIMNLQQEKRNEHGEIDDRVNKGKDDSRKSLSYLLAHIFGTGIIMPRIATANDVTGAEDYAPLYGVPQPRTYTGAFS